mmetsp:Transcript_34318/g.67492  ORF Transcript_34318/g.67492 Transcript_34318/m.67492 type:complete len:97 (-) Transcript_34318:32-322(-)
MCAAVEEAGRRGVDGARARQQDGGARRPRPDPRKRAAVSDTARRAGRRRWGRFCWCVAVEGRGGMARGRKGRVHGGVGAWIATDDETTAATGQSAE